MSTDPAQSLLALQWRWPVRVYAMGEFRLELCGKPHSFKRGMPRMPLLFLKLMVAHRNLIQFADACRALWPNRDLARSRGPMDTLILRLRRLLGNKEAVTVRNQMIALNPRVVWVDALVL